MFCYRDVSKKEIMDKYFNTDFGDMCLFHKVENLEDIYQLYLSYNGKQKGKLDRDFESFTKRRAHVLTYSLEGEKYDIKLYSSEDLEYNDMKNKGNILILDSPTSNKVLARYNGLKKERLIDIKDDLTHTAMNGHNYLREMNIGIGKGHMPYIVNTVNMYTEQIERQAALTDRRDINLFDLDRKAREQIVSDQIKQIILWLVLNETNGFVWGEMTQNRKIRYLESILSTREIDEHIKNSIAKYIIDYITLEEAEHIADGIVLRRFLK